MSHLTPVQVYDYWQSYFKKGLNELGLKYHVAIQYAYLMSEAKQYD